MSQVSTAYDAIVTRLAAVLTSVAGWSKLPNAYELDRNPEIFLKQGYAIGFGNGSNTHRLLSKTVSINREFNVSITRSLDQTELEVAGAQSVEKSLLEDLKLVIADIESQASLNSGQIFASYQGDNGIEFVDGETSEFLAIKASFVLEYFETI